MTVRDPEPAFLRAAVGSVLHQGLRELELVVVEDPGPRAAAAVLAEFVDPRVRHVCNPRGAGLVAARNQGLALARAELVAILDGDDECAPQRLLEQKAFLDTHAAIAVVGSQLEVIDAAGARLGYRVYPREHAAIVRALRRYNPLAHPSVMFRKGAVLAAGGYTEAGGSAGDDYELWSRMAQRGAEFANLDTPLVRYRLHSAAMKSRLLRATLRATLRVKRTYWHHQFDAGDRWRMFGEQVLLCLPPALVGWLFRRWTLRAALPPAEAR